MLQADSNQSRAERRRAARAAEKAAVTISDDLGLGRALVRRNLREAERNKLRRGCELILGRRSRTRLGGQVESMRNLLSATHRLEADRAKRAKRT